MATKVLHMTRGPFGTVKPQDSHYAHIPGGDGLPHQLHTCKDLGAAKRLAREHGFDTISFIENVGAQRPYPRIINL